jgi:hypothetical protein
MNVTLSVDRSGGGFCLLIRLSLGQWLECSLALPHMSTPAQPENPSDALMLAFLVFLYALAQHHSGSTEA